MAYSTKEKALTYAKNYYRANREKILDYKRQTNDRTTLRRRRKRITKRNLKKGRDVRNWMRRIEEAVQVTQIVNHFARENRLKKFAKKPNYKILNQWYKTFKRKDIARVNSTP